MCMPGCCSLLAGWPARPCRHWGAAHFGCCSARSQQRQHAAPGWPATKRAEAGVILLLLAIPSSQCWHQHRLKGCCAGCRNLRCRHDLPLPVLSTATLQHLQTRTFTYGGHSVVLKEGALGDGTGAKVRPAGREYDSGGHGISYLCGMRPHALCVRTPTHNAPPNVCRCGRPRTPCAGTPVPAHAEHGGGQRSDTFTAIGATQRVLSNPARQRACACCGGMQLPFPTRPVQGDGCAP